MFDGHLSSRRGLKILRHRDTYCRAYECHPCIRDSMVIEGQKSSNTQLILCTVPVGFGDLLCTHQVDVPKEFQVARELVQYRIFLRYTS